MVKIRHLLAIIGIALSFQAHAIAIDDFHGTWKEVGYRCVGEKSYKSRPFPARKLLTIEGYTYNHRVEMDDQPMCPYVQSSGSLQSSYTEGSHWLEIYVQPENSVSCYEDTQSPLVDDFILDSAKRDLWVSLDDIEGQTYLLGIRITWIPCAVTLLSDGSTPYRIS